MPPLRSHWTLRIALVACVLGLLAVLARDHQVRQPAYLLRRARQAHTGGDRPAAIVFVRSLLAREPNSADGRVLLSRLLLETAQARNPGARLADVPPALDQWRRAAALRPRDAALQRPLMDAEAQAGRLDHAAATAARLLAVRPDDADAHYLCAAKALRDRDGAEAEIHLRALGGLEPSARFRTRALEAKLHAQTDSDQRLDALLARAEADALALADQPARFHDLAPGDRSALLGLVFQYVECAPCVPEALARAENAMTVLERLLALAPDDPEVAADVGRHAAAFLEALERKLAEHGAQRPGAAYAAILERFEHLAAAAVVAGTASPAVAERAALAAVARGDDARAQALLERALRDLSGTDRATATELAALRLLLVRRLFAAGRPSAAGPHVAPLRESPATAGWADLFAGALRLDEGRDAEALESLLAARAALGDRPLVRIALVRARLARREWNEALDDLAVIHRERDHLSAEELSWLRHNLGDDADLHRLTAWAHAELGQWPQAQPHLEALRNTRHVGWAVRVAAGRAGGENAVALLKGAHAAAPERLDLVLGEAAALAAQGRDADATAVLERFAAAHADDLAAQAALLRARLSRGLSQAALAHVGALAARWPNDPAVRLLRAETLLATGQPEPALGLCRELIAVAAPTEVSRSAPLIGALAALQLQRRNEAAELLEQSLRVARDPSLRLLQEGGLALLRDDYETASARFAAALAYTAVREPARVALGQAVLGCAAARSAGAASAILAPLRRQYPAEPAILGVSVELALRRDRFDEAAEHVRALGALRSSRNEADYLGALVTARRGQCSQARAELEALLKRRPDHLAARLLLVELLGRQSKHAEALAEANEAVRRAPEHADAVLARTDALDRLGRRDEAIAALDAFVARHPQLAAPQARLALLYGSAGQAGPARERLDAALRTGLDPAVALRLRVQCLCRLGRNAEVDALTRQAWAKARSPELALTLSEAFAAEHRWSAAEAWTEEALKSAGAEVRPKLQARAADFLVLQAQDRPAERKALLQAACDRWRALLLATPGDLVAANNLAWFLATEFGQAPEAREFLERARAGVAIEALPEEVIATLATIDRQVGRLGEARDILERRAALRPAEARTAYHLGLVYLAEERPVVARTALLRALQLGLDGEPEREARTALEGMVRR